MTAEERAKTILGLPPTQDGPAYLSMRVEHLWRAEGFAPVVPFHGSIFIPMGRDVDLDILRQSLVVVMRRHDVLHSRLTVSFSRAIQLVDPVFPPELEIVDVARAQILAYREAGDPSPLGEFVDTPLDLTAGSGFRCRLFRDENDDLSLGLLLHHYFGDGWSSQILRREIFETYAALREGRQPEFLHALQYSDYALAERQSLTRTLDAQLSYWHGRLANAPPLVLPRDHARATDRMGRLYFGIDGDLAARLAEMASIHRVSIFAVYLAAWQLLLARWCGQDQIITAVNTADRTQPQFQNTVGYLMASVPVYTEIMAGWRVPDLLKTVSRNFFDGYGRRDLSYDLYDAVFEPVRPFCTTLFNFIPLQDKLSAARRLAPSPPLEIQASSPVKRVRVHREIYFCLVELARGMTGKIYYNLDFFERNSIEAQIAHFLAILEEMAVNPEARVEDIC